MELLSCFNLAFLGLLIASVGAGWCPRGWDLHQGSCYGFFKDKMTWAEAELDCQIQGHNGHLASITSRAEAAVVARQIKASQQGCVHVWIGLYDPSKSRRWRWTDQTLPTYKSWMPGEPNNNQQSGEYCTELWCHSEYLNWNDERCSSLRPYICRFEV
ncbi:C-type lectin-like [Heteronotia binoei]|uniref:C-type lectin-like n=1 Tax=Heteronotia binoei TaxID=13085 RepID=UPI00292D155E|nr:C-type lectin-like [Heteronotia binoei]